MVDIAHALSVDILLHIRRDGRHKVKFQFIEYNHNPLYVHFKTREIIAQASARFNWNILQKRGVIPLKSG